MNERIEALIDQMNKTGFPYQAGDHEMTVTGRDLEYFAELIVRECAVYCDGHIIPKGMAEENDLNYNDGVMDCVIGLKLHFGVKA